MKGNNNEVEIGMDREKKIERIVQIIQSGEKKKENFKIGVELEHIIVKKHSFHTVSYYEEKGIETILKKLLEKNYTPKYENNYLVGLKGEMVDISLEPAGQLELSIYPYKNIKEIETIYISFLQDIIPILEEQNQLLMAIGYHPKTTINTLPFNPKKRYEFMSDYFKAKGKLAHNMMKGTASLQVGIDYENEEDFIKKFKVANYLSPIFYLITDNAPIFEGNIYEKNSIRSTIWEDTDKDRCGIVPGSIDKYFGYKEYAEYILNTSPIFIEEGKESVLIGNKKAEEIINYLTTTDGELEHILSMVFPDVRVKKYIEIRSADTLPFPYNLSYIALIKGIFYNEIALNYLYQLAKEANEEKIINSKKSIADKGFEGRFGGITTRDFAPVLFDLAKQGLNEEEKACLIPLEKLVLRQKTPAMLSKELVRKLGLEGLLWCTLNHYGRREKDDIHRNII
jgi:glutamate--cysteine ligase